MKEDRRRWKDITPLEIPAHIAKPDLELIKEIIEKKETKEDDTKVIFNKDDEITNENEEEEDQQNENEDENEDEDEEDEKEDDNDGRK